GSRWAAADTSRRAQGEQYSRGHVIVPHEGSLCFPWERWRCATNPVVGSLLRILLHPRNLSSESVGDPPHQIGEVHQRLAEIKEDEKFAIGHWRSASEESYAAPRSVIAHPNLGPE